MATGDVKNNLQKLLKELKHLNYPIKDVNLKGLSLGTPASFLPILHYVFLDFSVDLTEFFAKEYELYGKSDLRFIETVYKILRDIFQHKPTLTREQFLTIGFAERKIILLCDILKKCREKYMLLDTKGKQVGKKRRNKIKAMLCSGEKLVDDVERKKVLQEIQSCPTLSYGGLGTEKQKTDKSCCQSSVRNTGKSILIARNLCEEKENKSSVESCPLGNEMSEERGITDETKQPFSQQENIGSWEEEESGSTSLYKSDPIPRFASRENITENTKLVLSQPWPRIGTLPLPPKVIPAPALTAPPQPSPDLMLTPIAKSGHHAIPLSDSKDRPAPYPGQGNEITDVSLIDLTESTSIAQAKIVRHTITEQPPLVPTNMTIVSQDSELMLLQAHMTELKDKLDNVLAQNNEMSARIVLLENKVTFLEESTCACRISSEKSATKNVVISSSSEVFQQLATNQPMHQRWLPVERKTRYEVQTPGSSRKLLLNGFSEPKHNSENISEETPNKNQTKSTSLIEISDDDSDTSQCKTDQELSSARQPGEQGLEVISPLQPMSDIHLKFSDPTTTATILNVERRLKETRAMLANATRLPQTDAF